MTEPTGPGHDETGLRPKYQVSRTDGRDQPGEPHHGCELFILDLTHDPHARHAALAYAKSARDTRRPVSDDLVALVLRLDAEHPIPGDDTL